jgi:hypothetical protein
MFPGHCKEVSVKKVSFELTASNIKQFLTGKKAYIRTRFYVFNSGSDWAVALIVRKLSNDVLQDIASVHVLSLPEETAFVEDSSLDVLSASAMGALREQQSKKCVVVKGKAEHVSFFIEEPPYELTVFDVVPPEPSKLTGLVETVLETDLQDRYVRTRVITVNLNSLARTDDSDITMYPCRASGLTAGKNVCYLDETPELTAEQVDKVTLIGCSLSERIFVAVYGKKPKMVNMCPQDLVREHSAQGPVLLKCCKVKEGFEVKGNIGIVPWGARSSEISEALRAILR